ncbi:MAG: hypothetical protein DHS20C14_01730 [Phycisphaeraceae bacterium]|nr:MAG: hypothetical protein DHS20C14_01730 [Phycisphaeraceae bacterium]
MADDRAYLSIVDWPAGWGVARRVESLVAASGMDPHTCQLRCASPTPAVVGLIDAMIADDVVGALRADDVTAFAPSQGAMKTCPAPERVKSLHVFPDKSALGIEFWRGDPAVVRASDIRLMARGDSRTKSVSVRPTEGHAAVTFEGAVIEAATDSGVSRVQTDTIAMLLDIYTAPAGGELRRLRVDADKMSFDVLGTERGYTDRENMGKLTARMRSLATGGSMDEGFERFTVPTSILRARGSAGRTAAFDFYTAWLCELYRSLGAL